MVNTVREFVDLIASGNPKKMLDAIRDAGLTPPPPDTENPAGVDSGLPVTGECDYATYPIYIAPSSAKGFGIRPVERVKEKLTEAIPFGAGAANKSYLTPANDFSGWVEIKAENMPKLCVKVMVVGEYAIWVDKGYPGGKNQFTSFTPTHLIADFLLRCDTRHVVWDEAVRLGCHYLTGSGRSSVMKPVAVLTRLDAAIELNVQSLTWDLMPGIPEPSVVNNKSQHAAFAILAKEGTIEMTGEQVAKLVLSCEDGMSKMAQIYKDNLEDFLSLTRFRILHPLDTVGVFMRESQSLAMVQTVFNSIPTRHYFPVWLHDTILHRWYRLSTGFSSVSEDTLPATISVAGTLCGVYEVAFDAEARDTYTYKQLAWLASIIMQSQYIPVSDAVTAMRGCMWRINSVFARALSPELVEELEVRPGTRIADLTSDPVWASQVEATIAISHGKTSAYRYTSIDARMSNYKTWPNRDMDISASIQIGGDALPARVLANMLVAFAQSDMLAGWENVIAHDTDLEELVEPPATCIEFYSKVPHVYDPPIVTSISPLYLQYSDAIYTLTYVGGHMCWGLADEMHPKAEKAGEFFGGELYYVDGIDDMYSDTEFTDLIRSTLSMFGDFSKAPTVYRYLYTIGMDDSWSKVGAPDAASSVYVASCVRDMAMHYSLKTNLWEFTHQELSDVDAHDDVLGILLPDDKKNLLASEVSTMVASLQACIPGMVKDVPGVQVPPHFKSPRGTARECENPKYSVEYKGTHYTYAGGLKMCDPVADCEISPKDLLDFLRSWIEQMVYFPQGTGAFAEISEWGFSEPDTATPATSDIGAFLYFNDKYYIDLCREGRTVPDGFHFPPKDTAPDNIGVGLFLECDGFRGLSVMQLGALCTNVSLISNVIQSASDVPCPESEEEAKQWYDTRPAGRAAQRKKTAVMLQLNVRPLIAVYFPNGDVAGWDGERWGASRIDGLKHVAGQVYIDPDRQNAIVDVERCKDVIERCILFTYTPPAGMYRNLRALKLMR